MMILLKRKQKCGILVPVVPLNYSYRGTKSEPSTHEDGNEVNQKEFK